MRAVYVDRRGNIGTIDEPRLDATSERHIVAIPPLPAGTCVPAAGANTWPLADGWLRVEYKNAALNDPTVVDTSAGAAMAV